MNDMIRSCLNVTFRKKLLLQKDTALSLIRKNLNWLDLFGFGLGATIGAGLFVLVGKEAPQVGPGLSISFLLGGFVCLLSGLCFAEFASAVPLCGSVYTYTYITMGELPAMLIGWVLIGEYVFSAGAVARAWGSYLDVVLNMTGVTIPPFLKQYSFSHFITFELTSILMILTLTLYLLLGIKIASFINWLFNILTILVILMIIIFGSTEVKKKNWEDFLPYGIDPIFMEIPSVIFAYIGFDFISSFSEEVKNPQRNIPLSIVATVVCSSLLYVTSTLVVTGITPYDDLDENAPFTSAFLGHAWAEILIAFGAIASLFTSAQVGISCCTRMLLAMSRDGLLPPYLSAIHPKTQEPWKAHLTTGGIVLLCSFLYDLQGLSRVVSLAALCSFSFVNASVILLREKVPEKPTNNNLRIYLLFFFLTVLAFSIIAIHSDLNLWLKLGFLLITTIPSGLIFHHFYRFLPFPLIVNSTHYVAPMVPLVPLVGIFTNIFLACGFQGETYYGFIAWLFGGLVLYSMYGVWFSVERRQEGVGERSPLFREDPYDS